jgi:hypothetical protein
VEEAQAKLAKVKQVLAKTQQESLPTMDLVHATKRPPSPFFLHVSLHLITTNNLL